MERPYIICHMVTSLDGKVTGSFLERDTYNGLIEDYYRIHREYDADGFLCGRVTMESSFPQPLVLPTVYDGLPIERVDHIAERAPFYAVAIDPKGKLWWSGRAISDPDEGYGGAHIIEVLTQDVSDVFLAHLRAKGVSYLFGGKTELNLSLVAQKLKQLFDIKKMLLEGGGIVNGSFFAGGSNRRDQSCVSAHGRTITRCDFTFMRRNLNGIFKTGKFKSPGITSLRRLHELWRS